MSRFYRFNQQKGQIQNWFPSFKTIQTRKMPIVSRINSLVDKENSLLTEIICILETSSFLMLLTVYLLQIRDVVGISLQYIHHCHRMVCFSSLTAQSVSLINFSLHFRKLKKILFVFLLILNNGNVIGVILIFS